LQLTIWNIKKEHNRYLKFLIKKQSVVVNSDHSNKSVFKEFPHDKIHMVNKVGDVGEPKVPKD
jgi:hypothetical protein